MRPLLTAIIVAAALVVLNSSSYGGDARPSYDPKTAFSETDTNRDGQIDLQEFQLRIVDVFFLADANKDGYLGEEELNQLPAHEAFKMADRDADGRVSMPEFLRIRIVQFTGADANDDGKLSLEEVEAAFEGRKP